MRSRTFSGELGFKKKPLEIARKKLSSTQIEILLTKILLTMKIFISHQQIMRTFIKKLLILVTKKWNF